MEQWPEGPAADPEATRERYTSDMRASRKALREVIRADLPAPRFGLGVVFVASIPVGLFAGPVAGALMPGSSAAPFLFALVVILLRGIRGLDAGHRGYLFTFGWANWVQGGMGQPASAWTALRIVSHVPSADDPSVTPPMTHALGPTAVP